jgi:uncharacterized membrane protein
LKQLLKDAIGSGDAAPQDLQRRFRTDTRTEMQARRAIVGVSLIGVIAMGLATLLQTGVVRNLPDPPVKRPYFDTKKVNTSDEAFSTGMPDAPIALVTHAVVIALAAAGPPNRYEQRPALPLAALALAVPQALVAFRYLFHQMPKVDHAWCPYCVVDAITHFAVLGLSVPEAFSAVSRRAPELAAARA